MRQRGSILVYGVIALALLAGLYGLYNVVESHGYARGAGVVQKMWDDSRLAAEQRARERRETITAALNLERQKTANAEERAAKFETDWRRARDEARRSGKPLGSCPGQGSPAGAPAADGAVSGAPAGAGIRAAGVGGADRAGIALHWRFVGLWDGAYVGLGGEPLFSAQTGHAFAPERADSPSPYGLGELIDVHGENARRFGACLRAFDDAMRKLDAAAEAWDRVGK